jgi:ribosomal protein L12E/L44/L45/RPP1/RPP2
MAKNFPYFKFVATEWLTGDIVLEDLELQGIFINVCALYWHREAKITINEIEKRLKTDRVKELVNSFIELNQDNTIVIKFLDEQLIEANHVSKVNSENGKLGAIAKRIKATAKRPLSDPQANFSKEEEEQEEEQEEEKKHTKGFSFKRSLIDYGFNKDLVEDWLKVRKTKSMTNTKTAFNKFISQIEKIEVDKNLLLQKCVERSWGGFDAKWLENDKSINENVVLKKRSDFQTNEEFKEYLKQKGIILIA